MENLDKFGNIQMEGDTMPNENPDSGKRQANFYLDREIDQEIRKEVFERQMVKPGFSRSELFNDAMRTYLMVIRYQKALKNDQETYEFVQASIKNFLGPKRK